MGWKASRGCEVSSPLVVLPRAYESAECCKGE